MIPDYRRYRWRIGGAGQPILPIPPQLSIGPCRSFPNRPRSRTAGSPFKRVQLTFNRITRLIVEGGSGEGGRGGFVPRKDSVNRVSSLLTANFPKIIGERPSAPLNSLEIQCKPDFTFDRNLSLPILFPPPPILITSSLAMQSSSFVSTRNNNAFMVIALPPISSFSSIFSRTTRIDTRFNNRYPDI